MNKSKPLFYNKININNIVYDSKTKNLYYKINGSNIRNGDYINNFNNSNNFMPLIIRGGSMIISKLSISNNNNNHNIDLLFDDDNYCEFTYNLDCEFIRRLSKNYKNIENEYIHSTRTSIHKDINNIFIRCVVSNNIEYYNQYKELLTIDDINNIISKYYKDEKNINNENDENNVLTCIPLFKTSLKSANNFKYIEYELIQLKINLPEEDNIEEGSILTECVILDNDEKDTINID